MPGAQRSDLCLQPENAQALGGIPGASIGTRRSTKAAATTFTSQRLAGPRQMEALVLTRHKPSVASYPTESCGRDVVPEGKKQSSRNPPHITTKGHAMWLGVQRSRGSAAVAVVGAVGTAALVLVCVMVHVGRTALVARPDALALATAALQRDLAQQHNAGSKVKAWVAASAMHGVAAQLKPARTQMLMEVEDGDADDGVGLALPMVSGSPVSARESHSTSRSHSYGSEDEARAMRQSKQMDAVAGVHQGGAPVRPPRTGARTADEEAGLEAQVRAQGQVIKKLEHMLEKRGAAVTHPDVSQHPAASKHSKSPASASTAPPTLGSWAMARAAGNDFGTNVVHLYGDLAKNGRGVAVKNPYSSGIKQAESARGEPDFSGDREEDVDYWDEDEHPAEEAQAPRDEFALQGEPTQRDSKGWGAADTAAVEEVEEGDSKPPLTSWDMAKFANNVEAGGGTMGTNVAYMYDNLSKRGPYKKVESESPLDNDHYEDRFDEYKAPAESKLRNIHGGQTLKLVVEPGAAVTGLNLGQRGPRKIANAQ